MAQNEKTETVKPGLASPGVMVWIIVALVLGLGMWIRQSPIAGASDVRVHVRSAHAFFMSLIDNVGYPDWDATAYGGRGTPMLRYIGPLPLIIASFFQVFGFDAQMAVKGTVVIFALVGLFAVHRWLVSIHLVAAFPWIAIFMMVQPVIGFHLGVALIFQNICAHFLAPWLWLAANKVYEGDRRAIAAGGIALGVIAWTHLLFALMVGYAWEILMLIGWLRLRHRRFLLAAVAVPVLAGAFAAPYILPTLLTKSDVYYEEVAAAFSPGKLYCDFLDDPVRDKNGQELSLFSSLAAITLKPQLGKTAEEKAAMQKVSILQIMDSPDRNNALRPWILVVLILSLLLGFMGVWTWRYLPPDASFPPWAWLLAGGWCVFMTLSWSKSLYEILPGTTNLQFPFRWALPALGLLLPIIAAALTGGPSVVEKAETAADNQQSSEKLSLDVSPLFWQWPARAILVMVILAGLYLQTLFWALPATSMQEFYANPGHLQPFYPRAVPDRRKINTLAGAPHQLKIASGTGRLLEYQAGVTWFNAGVEAASPIQMLINTHYDRYWTAGIVDGQNLPVQLVPEDGTMVVNIPAGTWKIVLSRESPSGRTVGWFLMIAAMIVFAVELRVIQFKVRS